MKSKETIQKTRPIADGLYEEVYKEYQPPVKAPDLHPTPVMDVAKFEKFVEEIKLLAARAEKLFEHSRPEFKFYNGRLVNYFNGFGLGNWKELVANISLWESGAVHKFFEEYKKFRESYPNFFSLVCLSTNGHEYFNLDFYPRHKGKAQTLFTAFVNALYTIHGITRLKKGREKKSSAIKPKEWAVVEKLQKKGKGTEGGSVRFCAEEIRLNRGKKTPKTEPALRRAIRRENHRRKETRRT